MKNQKYVNPPSKLKGGDASQGSMGKAYGNAKTMETPGAGKHVKPTNGDFSSGKK